ncbi:hypothetical protein Ae201684_001025 [Aphanomyces euteiches]|uniref:Disease resistance R13L4/SHOC-2-like LRR domain-containing protein n=1 Tax=Aphanomyces euteiches TaxID=100861 RepID=A0A6G0XV52_9STRA|nr:hypothetical protein Ae201684_001025 [Aphanomyces euteiches]KAH9140193.1 hypothetical protein AeRB84_015576 [Aphanomyces euteiches]
MTKEIEDPTIRSNVFPRSQLQGDGLLYVPKDENATKRPKPAPIVNIHKEYAVTHSYEKTRQTIKEIITQHKAKALSNQERYVREQEAEMYKTAFLETRLATTGVPTLNTISVVMERRRAQGESQMKGLTSDTPTQAESIQMALQRSYGSGKLDIKSLAIDELPDAISSTFILQMARFITEVNVSRNEFRELSRQFCDAFPGCHTLNASENNIKSLAPEISRWTNLSSLILDYNRLDALPDILPSTLTNLSAARNRISSLPYMYRLSDLTAVDISNNQLVTLPNAMYELKLIRSFNCSRNKLISAALLPLPSFKSRHAKFSRDKTTDDDDIDKPGLRTRDWTQTIDPFTKQPVYYNRFTCETTRVRPAVLGKESTTTLPQIPKLHLPTAITEPTVDRVQQAKEFPGGWEIIFGIPTRFINHATGETVTRIPQELDRYGSFIYMKKLNLAGNQIQELPASMGELYQLETLEIEHNQLVTLPDAIGNLKSLTVLRLGSNYLTSLPKQFSLLPKLKELDVKLNRLAQLPDDIGNMTALTHIDASSNSLISVPPSVLLLRNLIAFNLVGNPNLKVPSASSQKNGLQAVFWEIKNQIHIDAKGMPPEPIQVTNGIADECVVR